MKSGCVSGVFAAVAFISTPVAAQESETLFVACMTHYGDNDRPNDVTPVARVVWPSVSATRMQIDSAYFGVMQERGVRFYKAQCWGAPTAEAALDALNTWEGLSGYGKRPRREQALNDIFPAMFDRSFQTLSRMQDGLSRSAYSAVAVGSAVDGSDNAKIEREREERRERAEAQAKAGPPQQLEITAGPNAAELRAQRHAEVEARNAAAQQKYQEELAKQQQAVADFNAATDKVAAEKAAQAARAEAAQEEFQQREAAHAAEVERQRQLYREQYKQVTGSYPSD